MIEPNSALTATSSTIDDAWTLNSLRIYFDTRLEALKELKNHDVTFVNERLDELEKMYERQDVADQSVAKEIDRRLQERQDQAVLASKERFEANREVVREAIQNLRNELQHLGDTLRESMHNGLRSVDERFLLAKEFNQQTSKSATDSLTIALAASKEAVNKAEQSVEKRFDSVNEFRQTLADMTARLIQRTEVDVVTKALGDKIDTVSSRMDRVQGAINGSGSTISYILAGLAVLIAGASGIIAFVSYNHAPSRDADRVRNFYLTPPPSGQIVPGPSRQ